MFSPTTFLLKEGRKRIVDINFNIDLFMHFIIIFSFLTIFFIYVISKMKSDTFKSKVDHILKDLIHKNTENIKKHPSLLPLDKIYNKEDSTVKTHNDNLIRLILTINGLLWMFFIVLLLILKHNCDSKLNIKQIIFENFILFIIIGFVQYLFFTEIAVKFISIEPSLISKKFVDALKKRMKLNANINSKQEVYSQLSNENQSQISKDIPSKLYSKFT